jgi:hypothetical protein
MPMHDWTRVDAGIFHDCQHAWIEEIKRALNGGLLPAPYPQRAANGGPTDAGPSSTNGGVGLLLAPPTYGMAFAAVPRRWRTVLEAPPSAK